MIVLLDSNTLGILAKPEKSFDDPSGESQACQQWFYGLLSRGNRVLTSEISDYEVRRGLLSDRISSKKTPPGLQVYCKRLKTGLCESIGEKSVICGN